MTRNSEELKEKILSGDFDEYTLNEYSSAILSDQRRRDIEKAYEWLKRHTMVDCDMFKNTMEKE